MKKTVGNHIGAKELANKSNEEINDEAHKRAMEQIQELKRRIKEDQDPVIQAARRVPVPSFMQTEKKDEEGIWHIVPHVPGDHTKVKKDSPTIRVFEAHDLDCEWEYSYLCNVHIVTGKQMRDSQIEMEAHSHAYNVMPYLKYHHWQLFEWRDDKHLHPFGSEVNIRVPLTPEEIQRLRAEKAERQAKEAERYAQMNAKHKKTQAEKLIEMTDHQRKEYTEDMTRKQRKYNLTRLAKLYMADIHRGEQPSPRRKSFLIKFRDECLKDGVITEKDAEKMKQKLGF